MSIKVRIYGGFLVVLLLTLGVGVVGWLSLSNFAGRVEMSDAAQRLGSKTGELALAAHNTLLTGTDRPSDAIAAERANVRTAIASLTQLGAGSGVTAAAGKTMTDS